MMRGLVLLLGLQPSLVKKCTKWVRKGVKIREEG
jgi:hypothetical protein